MGRSGAEHVRWGTRRRIGDSATEDSGDSFSSSSSSSLSSVETKEGSFLSSSSSELSGDSGDSVHGGDGNVVGHGGVKVSYLGDDGGVGWLGSRGVSDIFLVD